MDAERGAGFSNGVGDGEPVEVVGNFGGLCADEGAAVGDLVCEPVSLDLDDGAHPGLVLAALGGASAERPRDVGGWVLDDSADMPAKTVAENVIDLVERCSVGVVGGEVAVSAVLAGVGAGDGAVELVGLAFEGGEVVLVGVQLEVGFAALLAGSLACFESSDLAAGVVDLGGQFLAAGGEGGEVSGSVGWRLVEHGLAAAPFGVEVSRAPR